MTTRFKAVIFDLDGTLLDTLEDLGESMNSVLLNMGFSQHPIEAYKLFVGDGMEELARRVLPQGNRDGGTVRACVEAMRGEYGKRWHTKTKPYKGICEMLNELVHAGVFLSVLSNKPHDFTKEVVRFYFDGKFKLVYGSGVFPRKPDPAGALHVARESGFSVQEFLYVGDTGTDMRTARAAGIISAGVLWGFRSRAELLEFGASVVVSDPGEILDLIHS